MTKEIELTKGDIRSTMLRDAEAAFQETTTILKNHVSTSEEFLRDLKKSTVSMPTIVQEAFQKHMPKYQEHISQEVREVLKAQGEKSLEKLFQEQITILMAEQKACGDQLNQEMRDHLAYFKNLIEDLRFMVGKCWKNYLLLYGMWLIFTIAGSSLGAIVTYFMLKR